MTPIFWLALPFYLAVGVIFCSTSCASTPAFSL
jgi:hypothetical protein